LDQKKKKPFAISLPAGRQVRLCGEIAFYNRKDYE